VARSESREWAEDKPAEVRHESDIQRKATDDAAWGDHRKQFRDSSAGSAPEAVAEDEIRSPEAFQPRDTTDDAHGAEIESKQEKGSSVFRQKGADDRAGGNEGSISHITDERQTRIADARHAVEDSYDKRQRAPSESKSDANLEYPLPLREEDISPRTTDNRINLADNVPRVNQAVDYGGYLDVVMHGDAEHTQANLDGVSVDFTLEQTAKMVQESPSWEHRPIRLMSCSTGQGEYAQQLADKLDVPVYAPTDILKLRHDGTMVIKNGGSWRRFEPVLK
jgi:hypothetical protein